MHFGLLSNVVKGLISLNRRKQSKQNCLQSPNETWFGPKTRVLDNVKPNGYKMSICLETKWENREAWSPIHCSSILPHIWDWLWWNVSTSDGYNYFSFPYPFDCLRKFRNTSCGRCDDILNFDIIWKFLRDLKCLKYILLVT